MGTLSLGFFIPDLFFHPRLKTIMQSDEVILFVVIVIVTNSC